MNVPKWLAIAGPTASGKTALALAVAQRWPSEIISVDSALVYRGMDVGTAKPTAAEQAQAPHHLIDILDPLESYSVAQFIADATRLIHEIQSRGRLPVLVGGTMLYFKGLFEGIDEMPKIDPTLRQAIEAQAKAQGWPALHAELMQVDPVTASRLAPNDAQRIGRALEVYRASGMGISHFQRRREQPSSNHPHNPCIDGQPGLFLALEPENRVWLHERIAQRFDAMLQDGFMEEVQRLRARGDLSTEMPSMRCVGYRQAWEALDTAQTYGRSSLNDQERSHMRDKAIFATRQLAKRQLTWLRSMPFRHVIPCDQPAALTAAMQWIETSLEGDINA